jgi:hypothetical protein
MGAGSLLAGVLTWFIYLPHPANLQVLPCLTATPFEEGEGVHGRTGSLPYVDMIHYSLLDTFCPLSNPTLTAVTAWLSETNLGI